MWLYFSLLFALTFCCKVNCLRNVNGLINHWKILMIIMCRIHLASCRRKKSNKGLLQIIINMWLRSKRITELNLQSLFLLHAERVAVSVILCQTLRCRALDGQSKLHFIPCMASVGQKAKYFLWNCSSEAYTSRRGLGMPLCHLSPLRCFRRDVWRWWKEKLDEKNLQKNVGNNIRSWPELTIDNKLYTSFVSFMMKTNLQSKYIYM